VLFYYGVFRVKYRLASGKERKEGINSRKTVKYEIHAGAISQLSSKIRIPKSPSNSLSYHFHFRKEKQHVVKGLQREHSPQITAG